MTKRRIPTLLRRNGGRFSDGAGAAPWSPSDFGAALVGDFRAEVGVTTVEDSGEDRVSNWANQASGGDVSQGTATNRPLFVSTGFNGGSAPYISARRANAELLFTNSFDWDGDFSACTFIFIGRMRANHNGGYLTLVTGTSVRPNIVQASSNRFNFTPTNGGSANLGTFVPATDQPFIFRWRGTDDGSGNGRSEILYGETSVNIVENANLLQTHTEPTVLRLLGTGTATSDMDVNQILILNSYISDADIANVVSYAEGRVGALG